MEKVRIAVVGCGARGQTYCQMASLMPDKYEITAGADPVDERVNRIAEISGNPEFRSFASAEELLAQGKLADVLIIGTQDSYHYEPCCEALEKGYDILLEKPISVDVAEIIKLEALAEKLNRKVMVCYVLRYTPFYKKVKELLESNVIGDIVSLNANEGVVPWHQAHSFVRGHWAVTDKSCPMIVAKCCHDTDILRWLIGRNCKSVSSFGSLKYFTSENAPESAPLRCTDDCPVDSICPYNAKLYAGKHRFPWLPQIFDRAEDARPQEIIDWLKTSLWGRCVYHCDNTAVDHQVLAMEFEDDITASFTMTAFENERHLEIYGTKGMLRGGTFYKKHMGADIIVSDHNTSESTVYNLDTLVGGYEGHGGGDMGIMVALYNYMTKQEPLQDYSQISTSVHSHVIAFAAEKSRITRKTIELDDFYAEFTA